MRDKDKWRKRERYTKGERERKREKETRRKGDGLWKVQKVSGIEHKFKSGNCTSVSFF